MDRSSLKTFDEATIREAAHKLLAAAFRCERAPDDMILQFDRAWALECVGKTRRRGEGMIGTD